MASTVPGGPGAGPVTAVERGRPWRERTGEGARAGRGAARYAGVLPSGRSSPGVGWGRPEIRASVDVPGVLVPPGLTRTRGRLRIRFDSWSDVARVLAVGAAAYAFLVVVLRVSGKRTLSQMNAFDFVVTVALGSTLATILLSSDVSWTEGAVALALLAGLQLLVALLSTRWGAVRRAVTAQPVVLVADGLVQHDAVRANRITESQIAQAVRSGGFGDVTLVAAVVLEPNGTLSVIGAESRGDGSALP